MTIDLSKFRIDKSLDPRIPRAGSEGWVPLNPADGKVPTDLYGPPQGWDYRTAKTDWQGKPLPEGASSFDKYGRPYYGGGLAGWFKGVSARFSAPANNTMSWEEIRNFREDGKGALWAVQQTWDKLTNTGDEEENPTLLSNASRFVGAAVGTVLDVLQVPATVTKEVAGGTALGLEAAGEGSPLPSFALPEFMKDADDDGIWERRLKDAGQILTGATIKPLWDTVRAVTSPDPNKADAFAEAYQAGKIAYTAFADAAIKAEYIRRVNAGEDAGLLAIELGLPGAEAFGEIIFDPLNLLTLWTKPATVPAAVAKLNVVDDASDVGRAFSAAADAARAGDEIGTAGRLQDLSRAVRASIDEVVARNDKIANARGLLAHTPRAAAQMKADLVGDWVNWLASVTKNDPERMVETLNALSRLHGDDAERMAAIAELMHFNGGAGAKLMFSQNAIDTGMVMRNMDPVRFVDDITNIQRTAGLSDAQKIEQILELGDKKLLAATEKMFPTILQRIENGEDVSGFYANIAKFDAVAQSAVLKPLNTFFATIYMGMNPGFAVRNLLTNTVGMFTDAGVASRFRSMKSAREGVTSWVGAMTARGVTAAGDGKASSSLLRPFQFALRFSERMERADRTRLHFAGIERFMKRAMVEGRAIPPMAGLRRAGMSDDITRVLERKIFDNFGDVEKSVQEVLSIMGEGSVPLTRTAGWANRADLAAIDKISDGASRILLKDIAAATSPDEQIAVLRAFYTELSQEAAKAFDEVPLLGRSVADDGLTIGRQVLEDSYQAKDLGYLDDAANTLTSHRMFSNSQTYNKYLEVLNTLDSQVGSAAMMAGQDTAQIRKYQRMTETAREIITRSFQGAGDEWRLLRQSVWDLKNRLRGIPRKQGVPNLADEWKRLGLTGEVPARMTPGELLSKAWDDAYDKSNLAFGAARDRTAATAEAAIDDIVHAISSSEGAPKLALDGTLLQEARRAAERARYWQNAQRGVPNTSVLPELGAGPITYARGIAEQMTAPTARQDDITKLIGRLERGLMNAQGKSIAAPTSPKLAAELAEWTKDAVGRAAEAKLLARAHGREVANFALLNYANRRNIDTAMSYLFMFPYWHTRTYANWTRRLTRNPGVIAAYAKYREALAQMHAGAPDWWKNNVNTNELFGLDSENPLFFNLEATLNPLNGLTGVDFDDKDRRKHWLSSLTQDLGRFGPSPWTPLNWIAAMGLYKKGEEEAAQKALGTLLPISRPIRAATSLLGANDGKGVQIDPFVNLIYGGLDPYERRRVGRALSALVNEGADEAEAIEAARTQTGPLWDEAIARGLSETNWGALSSYTLGVGFRGRSINDMQVDKFYNDYYRLWEMRPNLTQQEWSAQMTQLKTDYPFMDTLLISRKGGPERDTAYAYNVIQRIPPSGSSELFDAVGLPRDLYSKFFDSKGDMRDWSESDRNRFMSAVTDLGAVLDIPNNTTRVEWRIAKDDYAAMIAEGEAMFGPDVADKEEIFYSFGFDTPAGRDAASAFVRANPDLEQYMDWKERQVITRPLLAPYYGGIDQIRKHLINQMYDAIEAQIGDTSELWSEYYALKDSGNESAARSFYNQNPQLRQYQKLRDAWTPRVDAAVIALGKKLPQGIPATARDVIPQSVGQEAAMEYLQTRSVSEADVITAIGLTAYDIVIDSLSGGRSMPSSVRTRLESYAESIGISFYELMRQIGNMRR